MKDQTATPLTALKLFLAIALATILLVVGVIIFSYVIVAMSVVISVTILVAYIKSRMAKRREAESRSGRTIDHPPL